MPPSPPSSPSSPLPGAAGSFPSTHWSRILAPGELGEARKAAWEALAATYWRPVYAYVRARWARSSEDALDCTQEFFLHVLEGSFLERADPERGRFRAYVKTALSNFVRDLERKRRTLKRGGARTILSTTGADEDGTMELPDTIGKSPDEALDDAWRAEVMATATRSLEAELASQGKDRTFRVFQEYFLSESELDYAEVARRHDIKASDVSNDLQYAKKRFRAVLRAVVADTVGDREDLETELAWLFGREER